MSIACLGSLSPETSTLPGYDPAALWREPALNLDLIGTKLAVSSEFILGSQPRAVGESRAARWQRRWERHLVQVANINNIQPECRSNHRVRASNGSNKAGREPPAAEQTARADKKNGHSAGMERMHLAGKPGRPAHSRKRRARLRWPRDIATACFCHAIVGEWHYDPLGRRKRAPAEILDKEPGDERQPSGLGFTLRRSP
jgi:hypothetical protein